MDAALSIASSSLTAATTEISVTSENIANAQTPGYAAESAQLAAQPGGDPYGVGDGVAITSVAAVHDALLSANNLQAQGALSSLSSLQQVLTAVQNVFPLGQQATSATTPSATSTNTSISGQLANFWSAWDSIANNPSALAGRTQVLDMAQGLVTSLHEASGQLSQLATNTAEQLQQQVTQVNSLLQDAASLNQSIVTTSGGGGNPNQLVDQLSNVTGQLASIAGANVQMQPNGSALISIGGVAVVQDSEATTLSLQGGPPASVQATGGVTVPVTSGSISGLLTGLNQSIPHYSGELDTVASNLANLVNGQLAQGVTAANVSGATLPLFTPNGGPTAGTVTAANIGVNTVIAADPTQIAAASPVTPPSTAYVNDGSNAAKLAELASTTGSTSPDSAYRQLIQDVGSQTANVNTQVTAQTSVAQQAQQALQAATGVNSNTELTNLMQFQASYQASAKLVSVISTTMQSLLAAV